MSCKADNQGQLQIHLWLLPRQAGRPIKRLQAFQAADSSTSQRSPSCSDRSSTTLNPTLGVTSWPPSQKATAGVFRFWGTI